MKQRFIITAGVLLCCVLGAHAASVTWNNAGDDWFSAVNWDNGGVPGNGDTAVIESGTVLLDGSTASLAALVMNGGILTFSNWTTILNATNVTLNGGTNTCAGSFTDSQMSNRVYFACSNFTLSAGASIELRSKGYAGGVGTVDGTGPGGGTATGNRPGGGGYGGVGGKGGAIGVDAFGGLPYGSAAAPLTPGSGGAGVSGLTGEAGGGAVRIDAEGHVLIGGTIDADGGTDDVSASGNRGRGSGGSIYISCNTFASTGGVLRAEGGSGDSLSGPGGGGRISIVYDTGAQASIPTPTPLLQVAPGTGANDGRFGTISLSDSSFLPSVLTANIEGRLVGFSSWSVSSLTVSNTAIGFSTPGFALSVSGDVVIDGASGSLDIGGGDVTQRVNVLPAYRILSDTSTRFTVAVGGDLTVTNGAGFQVYSAATNGGTPSDGAFIRVTGVVSVATTSTILSAAHPLNGGAPLFEFGSLTVATGGEITADFHGFHSDTGPGKGGTTIRAGGGGYGGQGGRGPLTVNGGPAYGSTNAPLLAGSAGGSHSNPGRGGRGGGLLRIVAAGSVTVNGALSADGEDGEIPGSGAGGGSGGAIFVDCGTFSGSGALTADGNAIANTDSGGGGGGRIAVWINASDADRAVILAGGIPSKATVGPTHFDFSGTTSVTNGVGWGVVNDPPNGATPGTVVFIFIPPPEGTVVTVK